MEDDALQIELPHGPGSATRLDVPPAARLSADTALWVIESLTRYPFIAAEHAQDWGRIRALAEDIEVRSRGWYLDVSVGQPPEGSTIEGSYFDASHGHVLRMHCQRCHEIDCVHRLAFALALAWHDPRWKSELMSSAWSRFLEPLTGRPPAPAEDERPGGWIRVVLHDRPAGDSEIAEGRVSIQLVPLSRRSNKPLKPRRAPRSLEATENKVRGLAEGDRNLLRLVEQHRLLDHVATYRYADSRRVQDELARIERDIFAALDQVTEVFFDDRPLKIDPQPWCTALRVTDGPHGGLALRWAEAPRAIFPAGDGFVVDHGWRLRPLDPRVSIEALGLLERTPPEVPAGDIDAFVDQFVLATSIPIEIRARRLPLEDGTPTPRLVLRDDGGTLGVGVRFAYGAVEVDERSPPVIRPPFRERRLLVRRDRAKEREARRALRAVLPDAPLRGEVAYDFLLDGLAQLDGWEITADKSLDLRKLKPVGTLETQARLQSGIDWFDLQVAFQIGDASVSRAEVLRTWKEGRRYVELKDGSVARLPETWLQKHGEALVELDEMRGRRKRVGAHAAAVAEDLLAELGADDLAQRWRDLAQRIRQFDHVPERAPPPGLQATLRDYQHRGYRWMAALRELGLGGVLADDMGLGKTLQTLTLLLETHQPKGRTRSGKPSLVVAPTSVVHNWISEAARFAPNLRIHLHHGPKRGTPPTDVDVVITSFALLRVDAETLCGIDWRYAVLDEAQHIKNPASRVAQAARDVRAEHKLALSGTPLENHLIELWSMFEFLMPGFFGSRRAFQDRYVKPIQRDSDPDARAKALARLRSRIRPFVLRRLKREVASELPPRQEQVLYCDLGPAERRLYEAVKGSYRETVMGQVDSQGLGRSTIQILEALTRLRQAACDPTLLPFPEAQGVLRAGQASAKRALLRDTLAAAIDDGHRALVFSQWPSLLKRVIGDLDTLAADYLYLDGSTKKRGDLQARWNDPDGPPVFLISLKAGGTGLNLTGADVVIHLDPWWNPQVEAQATDRAHRIGQTKPVMVYKLVARGTVEEKIIELQERKRSLFEAAVDGDRVAVDALTRADLEAVLAADDDALGAADEVGDWEDPADDEALLDDSSDGSDDGMDDAADDSSDGIDGTEEPSDAIDESSDDALGEIDAVIAEIEAEMVRQDAELAARSAAPAAPTDAPPATDRPMPDALPRAIAERLYADGKLVNRTVREVLGCTAPQATAHLKRWTAKGLLKRRGRRQNTRYLPPE